MVIELTKSSECFGLWKNLFFGVNGNCLQERRFVNEDNVAEFLQSSLRPSTIPWSTQADPPMIHVLQMNNRRTHIQLNKPELEKESNLAHRERFADLKKQISYPSEEAEPSDTGRDDTSPQDSDDNEENQGGQLELQTKNPAECTCPEQREDNGAEDKAPNLKDIPTNELDEDDLPNVTKATQGLDLQNSEPRPVLKEVDSKANDTSDHKTQCAFRFENSLLFELD
uniref:Uncharacterized protein n=2 Tax=Pyxicephalus adspersus TaxID=30357 RepID=A0AAV2ZHU2_PYXAD|nr:TPA: hypothetical protein GDO54_005485 [Pyxicephalus adspersus]